MLDNDKQINAFGALSALGMVTPVPVTVCQEAVTFAGSLATSFEALLLAGATYPATVSAYTGKITGYATSCATASDVASAFISAVNPYATPDKLMQLKVGWDCYVKGNRLSPAPAFALVDAMGDTAVTNGLRDQLKAITLQTITAAMSGINAKVTAAAASTATTGAGGAPAAPVEPSFTAAEISALIAATDALDAAFSDIQAKNTALTDYTNQVNTSTSTAAKAMKDAVAITLTDGLRTDPVMGPAIAAIMPAAALAALT